METHTEESGKRRTRFQRLLERIDRVVIEPVNKFIKTGSATGIVLFLAAAIALVWANSPWSETYFHLWEYEFSLGFEGFELSKPLHHWINDGLMAVFFFVIGLEIKREVMAGELSTFRRALLPLGAAVGGMVIPALLYLLLNPFSGAEASNGWGVPMATDIAFSLGLLTLIKSRVPVSVKVFLTGLAIVDDLGAVLVIAFFYTSNISFWNLGIGMIFMLVLVTANIIGVRNTTFYGIVGIGGLWMAFLLSGVHATIAGVLAAFTIPARTEINEEQFVDRIRKLNNHFDRAHPNNNPLVTRQQLRIIERVRDVSTEALTPLQHLEYAMHPLVSYFVMPVFALCNAGIKIQSDFFELLLHPVSLGVIFGLLVGKFLGIVGVSKLLVRTGIAALPDQCTWRHLYGVGLLAGIGFTMSLFITELAFTDPAMVVRAKVGILVASAIAGIAGLLLLRFGVKPVAQQSTTH